MGINSYQAGDRNFGIGCTSQGLVMKVISNTGIVDFAYGVSVQGTLLPNRTNVTTDNLYVYKNCTMIAHCDVTAEGTAGSVRCYPPTDGATTSIAFYTNNNGGGSAAGNLWTIGNNTWGVGTNNLGIGCVGSNCVMSISSVGVVDFKYNVTNKGIPLPTLYTTDFKIQDGNNVLYYNLGRLNLPQGGRQAWIKVILCGGFNLNNANAINVDDFGVMSKPPNYAMDIYIFSSNGSSSIPVVNRSALFPTSVSCYHAGFVSAQVYRSDKLPLGA